MNRRPSALNGPAHGREIASHAPIPPAASHTMTPHVEVMTDDAPSFSFGELVAMSEYLAESRLIKGVETPAQAFSLILFAQSQGLHPGTIVSRYHLYDGQPSMKADVFLANFQQDGGRVEWLRSDDEAVEAVFTHPVYHPKPFHVFLSLKQLVDAEIATTWDRSGKMVLKANYRRSPAAMLRARAVTAGVRAIHPGVGHGIYAPEELDSLVERSTDAASDVAASDPALAAPAALKKTAAPPPSPAGPPKEDVRVRTMPDDAKVDPRNYVDLVDHEAGQLTEDIREHVPDFKVVSKHQLHRHLVKAGAAAGLCEGFAEGSRVGAGAVVERGQDLYREHRDWARTELARYVEKLYAEAVPSEAETSPAVVDAPPVREPGEDG